MNLVDSIQVNCGIDAAIVEDVCIDGLTCKRDPFFAHGAVYRHVVLKGRIDSVVLKSRPISAVEDAGLREEFDRAVRGYYDQVDWALDISEAECSELNIHGVPADLIRRDPESQAVVRSGNISLAMLDELEWLGPEFRMTLGLFLERSDEDVLLIAPRRRATFERQREEIERLREIGIADAT